jgi:hypothetical protein
LHKIIRLNIKNNIILEDANPRGSWWVSQFWKILDRWTLRLDEGSLRFGHSSN